MPIVRMDEKGRIQIPQEVRQLWRLKPKQPLLVEVEENKISVTKPKKLDPSTDPLLTDIMLRPGHSKVKVTREVLRKIKDEAWTA